MGFSVGMTRLANRHSGGAHRLPPAKRCEPPQAAAASDPTAPPGFSIPDTFPVGGRLMRLSTAWILGLLPGALLLAQAASAQAQFAPTPYNSAYAPAPTYASQPLAPQPAPENPPPGAYAPPVYGEYPGAVPYQ